MLYLDVKNLAEKSEATQFAASTKI